LVGFEIASFKRKPEKSHLTFFLSQEM